MKTGAALRAKVRAAIMEKVILPMAQAEGVELSDEELMGVSGDSGIDVPKKEHISRYDSAFHAL